MRRKAVALGELPANLADFPTTTASGEWFRAHTAGRGPWWFASDGCGRFDLAPPEGTCYVASHSAPAVHERLGETLVNGGVISGSEADRMVVSRLPLSERIADATVQQATRYGVTRELGTVIPYELPRRWASALRAAGHGGLRYWPRFSVLASYRAVALFGPAGADEARPIDPAPVSGRAAARAAGITVVDPPRTVSITDPPE